MNHDPGDEDDGERRGWRVIYGKPKVFYPRSWREERMRALPDHDGGDEDPWQPLSELSQRRFLISIGML